MSEKTNGAEVKVEEKKEVKTEQVKDKGGEAKAEPTAAEVAAAAGVPPEVKKEPEVKPKETETVPLATFLEEKAGRKEAERKAAELQAMIESGATGGEISAEVLAIAKEFNVDKGFLAKLVATMRKEAEKTINTQKQEADKAATETERQKKLDTAFNAAYDKAMERLGADYSGIVDKSYIKYLSMQPENANKTFTAIIETAYSSQLKGKRTIETSTPGGGKEPAPLDFERARKDTAYFQEVMADPALKKQYNEAMLKRGV